MSQLKRPLGSSRRRFLAGTAGVAAISGAPAIARGQTRRGEQNTVRAVMHGDISVFDPIWTTQAMAAVHGGMVYDTLFGTDGNYIPQPQMVGRHSLSDDQLTYTFELRDGLVWSDGTPVTAADCVASLRRWGVRHGAGQIMMSRTADISAKDERTIVLRLKERWGLVYHVLASTTGPLCFMMPKRFAETDPHQRIDISGGIVGSGPFIMNMEQTRAGTQYVYDRNPRYVPRSEPASGIAGGKVVHLDRVIIMNVPEPETAVAAVRSGEIDFYETPPVDALGPLEADPNLRVTILNELGNVGYIRLNHLHPPFNNVKARQAVLWALDQRAHLAASFPDRRFSRPCGSFLTCGTPMESDVATEWFAKGPDLARARQLVRESGYDGRPVLIMQATNIDYMRNTAEVLAQELRSIGFTVQLLPLDWGSVVQRRSNKSPPEQGGWSVFITSATGNANADVVNLHAFAATGDKAWFGWPENALHEELRERWSQAATLQERQAITRQLQENAWNYVHHVYFGQWVQPTVHRRNITGLIPVPGMVYWWNVRKT
jgi:peptide/nickel transport system substrate-binding protein